MEFIRTLFNPNYWLMNDPYNEEWDKKLNNLLDVYDFEIGGEFTARLGSVIIWAGNHPYGSFHPYDPIISVRPSRKTIRRAYKKLMKATGGVDQTTYIYNLEIGKL